MNSNKYNTKYSFNNAYNKQYYKYTKSQKQNVNSEQIEKNNNKKKEVDCFGVIYYQKKKEKKTKTNYYGYIITKKLNELYNINVYMDRLYVFCAEDTKDTQNKKLNIFLKSTKNTEKIIKYVLNNNNIDIKKISDLFIGEIMKKDNKLIFNLKIRDKTIEIPCQIEKYNDDLGKIILQNI